MKPEEPVKPEEPEAPSAATADFGLDWNSIPANPPEEMKEEPTEDFFEQPIEQPTENPIENPTEMPIEQPTENPSEEPAEQSLAAAIAQPAEASLDLMDDLLAAAPQPVSSDSAPTQPALDGLDDLLDAPIDQPIDQPNDEPLDAPIDEPLDEPLDAPIDEPLDAPIDAPLDEPLDGDFGLGGTGDLSDFIDDMLDQKPLSPSDILGEPLPPLSSASSAPPASQPASDDFLAALEPASASLGASLEQTTVPVEEGVPSVISSSKETLQTRWKANMTKWRSQELAYQHLCEACADQSSANQALRASIAEAQAKLEALQSATDQ